MHGRAENDNIGVADLIENGIGIFQQPLSFFPDRFRMLIKFTDQSLIQERREFSGEITLHYRSYFIPVFQFLNNSSAQPSAVRLASPCTGNNMQGTFHYF